MKYEKIMHFLHKNVNIVFLHHVWFFCLARLFPLEKILTQKIYFEWPYVKLMIFLMAMIKK